MRIPSLDGLRAVAISCVIFSHLPHPWPIVWRVDFGSLGVRIFFVISGFLITTLLVSERERSGTISLKGFYYRRFLRIIPAYWAFLAVAGLMLGAAALAPALVYDSDYQRVPLLIGHSWSLSVEEQFYVLWPCVIVLLGLKRATVGCTLVLFASPIFRVLADYGYWPTQSRYAFECVADALATGSLLAVVRERLWAIEGYRSLVSSSRVYLVACAGLLVFAVQPSQWIADLVALPLLNVGIVLAIDRSTRFPTTALGRLLNFPAMIFLGTLSYSLYLWQQPFTLSGLSLPIPMRLVGLLACAMMSYYLIERPFLRLKARAAPALVEGVTSTQRHIRDQP